MTRVILVSTLFFASTCFAADSPMLREIMGESVYQDSGISDLSLDQLQVLEKWILKNAVASTSSESVIDEIAVNVPIASPEEPNEQQKVSAKEAQKEPLTQAYVRVDTLDERNRNIEPDLIRSRIDGTFKGWTGKTLFKLENGDIWQQRRSSTFITTLESPEVVIKKGRMSFYTMEVPEIRRKVLVKRIR